MAAEIRRSPRIRILLWTRKARQLIMERLTALVPEENRAQVPLLISVLDELAKNAIKANHKFLLIRRKMREHFRKEGLELAEADRRMESICADAASYNEFLDQHPGLLDGVQPHLRDILNQEALWINVRNNPERTEAVIAKEKEAMKKTKDYRNLFRDVRDRRVYVEFRASVKPPHLWVEIINTAPILNRDLDRIREKREEFKKHREANTEHEFFMNHMDTSDGGSGLGYATIDTTLASLGHEPLDALYILSLHSTNVMMNLDLGRMAQA
ncbi:MAG TPA: hypothetical protein PKE49_12875 [Leptospiraceae bacterium]|nr:hypothetical protein [Leptospirales bacterium]HMU84224.1 hypothetical protein [Leptospiraceae bacterium]HMX57414.1 hypothetical protein [Leptospiraceae bacterium]HMY47689.1 hypothetical protein [Leptospiraceae bacterium]HNJ03551.1 hypothetical protein [Leptospiraceae bacterium]